MTIKKKILLRISTALIVTTSIIIAIVAFNIRNATLDSAKQKAVLVSEITEDALTAHMANGIMDKRDLFLSNIAHLKGVEKLRIIRGDSVIKQFGKTRENESPRDEIDVKVLKTGKSIEIVSENLFEAKLRTTIPYAVKTTIGPLNCLQCHEAKEGDVLGAITLEFDLGDIKTTGVETIVKIILVSLLSLAVIIFMLNRFLNPYLDLFTQLTEKIRAADDGDFSQRIDTPLKDEAGQAAEWFNEFMQKLEDAFSQIEQSIGMFVSRARGFKKVNPLDETKEVVEELSEIYKFKRTIEGDSHKMDIYGRIITLFERKFNISNFTIYEIDHLKNTRKAIVKNGTGGCCADVTLDNAQLCRSSRVGKNVLSDDFVDVCQFNCADGLPYVCIPVSIGGKVGLLINIMPSNEEDLARLKELLPKIEGFLNEATSVIESKKLNEILRESSLRDAMTGLYNRRFMDEYLSKNMPQVLKNKDTVALLMIDMDHFKMVNDTYGHDVGDVIIKKLSKTITENIKESDLAVRYGGEEFLVLLHGVDEPEAIEIAERLRLKVADMKVKAGNEILQKTISIGVSMFPSDTDSVWKCIKFADIALYRAKESGRNRVIRFNEEMWSDDGTGY